MVPDLLLVVFLFLLAVLLVLASAIERWHEVNGIENQTLTER